MNSRSGCRLQSGVVRERLCSFAFSLLLPGALSTLGPHPASAEQRVDGGRADFMFRIGSITFSIPAGLEFTTRDLKGDVKVWDSLHSSGGTSARPLGLAWILFVHRQVWPISGTHEPGQDVPISWEKLMIRLDPWAVQSDFYCGGKAGFDDEPTSLSTPGRVLKHRHPDKETSLFEQYGKYDPNIFGLWVPKFPVTFFHSPVVFMASRSKYSAQNRDIVLFRTTVALSSDVTVFFEFSNIDAAETMIGKTLNHVEQTLNGWMGPRAADESAVWRQSTDKCG